MSRTPSPLRYPGGKSSIYEMVSNILNINNLKNPHYAEPYAGGAGLALSLLFKGNVHELHLNDLDRSIWAFWNNVLNHTEQFVDKIMTTDVTIEEWRKQKEIQTNKNIASDFDLGFSSFFLNRTNRSGIILKAGVIGGLNQLGNYKLDCRFHKINLVEKINRIKKYSHRIHLYNLDAVEFIKKLDLTLPETSLFCIDPPYYEKGESLYTNFYQPKDHELLAEIIRSIKHPWILTYDNSPKISELYKGLNQYNYNINYSAAKKYKGTELLISNSNIQVPINFGLELLNIEKVI